MQRGNLADQMSQGEELRKGKLVRKAKFGESSRG